MVEFALTAPILVLLLLGVAEVGNAVNSYLTVLAAARDASRLAAEGGVADDTLLSTVAKETERLPTTLPTSAEVCNGDTAGVCVTHPTISSVAAVKVRVCYDHPLFIGIPGILSGTMKLCSATVMRQVT